MEYRLGKIYNHPGKEIRIDIEDVISSEKFEQINRAIQKVTELNNNIRLLDFVQINENELIQLFEKSLQKFLIKSVSWNGLKREDQAELFLNTNRLFLNYLSSVRTFIDHIDVFLHRNFGKKSHQYLQFKKMLTVFYDNSFTYRFFYKLRNYAQHVGLPIDTVQFTSRHNRENDNINGKLKIEFHRDRLLSNYDGWGPVKTDLLMKSEKFSVPPLIAEMSQNIKEIWRNVELLLKEELMESSNFIIQQTQHLRDNDTEIFLAHNFKETKDGTLLGFDSIAIPFETIDHIQANFN